MSAAVAGTFQDHYAVLGLDPAASSVAVAQAYGVLVEKFHPHNPDTGDLARFDAVNQAFEVLSDPYLRTEFDKVRGAGREEAKHAPKFSGVTFFDCLGREFGLRTALLCVLYDRRRTRPLTPSLSMRHLEGILDATPEELGFTLWYLRQRGLVQNDDKSNLQITVTGMDFLETNRPDPELVMQFIRT